MGAAYTPGLIVSANTVVEKERRLPIKGSVLVEKGQSVEADTVVARAELPGPVTTIRLAEQLGVEPADLPRYFTKKPGDRVEKGEVLAERKGLFGLLSSKVTAPLSGTVEFISEKTGNIGIRALPTPVEVKAYLKGVVKEVIPDEGVVVATRGTLIQGIFGLSGERHGPLTVIAKGPDEKVPESRLSEEHRGRVLVAGSLAHGALLREAGRLGVVGIIAGGVLDTDLRDLLGYDVGVAITGEESIPFTLIVTEGFGEIEMARRTFSLLESLEGRQASINGATQIRAGVIRPEVVVPQEGTIRMDDLMGAKAAAAADSQLQVGTLIRIIRAPYFGVLARVVALPPEPQIIETGAKTRVLVAETADGTFVTVPRANVEIFQYEEERTE